MEDFASREEFCEGAVNYAVSPLNTLPQKPNWQKKVVSEAFKTESIKDLFSHGFERD